MKRFVLASSAFMIILLFTGCTKEVSINQADVLFEVKKGESIHSVTKRLYSEKIIKNPTRFNILAKLLRKENDIKFGVYQIQTGESYIDLINKFSSGETYSIKITIPEGQNIFQIAEILQEKGLVKKEDFIKICTNKNFINSIGMNSNYTLEGYLFPDTYLIPLNYTSEKIISLMVDTFKKNIGDDYLTEIKSRKISLNAVITMASIVEKEAKMEFEKPIISGVYYNRLRTGMRVQADPTLIYALILAGQYNGDIHTKDFEFDSKYNTYKYFGLPPAPIANPGKTSILAAIYPAKIDYLYFVAKPDGTHQFSKTLQEHNKAVYEFQKLPAIERRKQRSK